MRHIPISRVEAAGRTDRRESREAERSVNIRNGGRTTILTVLVISIAITLFLASGLHFSFSSSSSTTSVQQSDFQNTNSEILTAYSQIYNVEHNGGNATSLINELNVAITLYDKAQSENATNPTQAALDLENASSIASLVQNEGAVLAQKASAQKTLQYSVEIGESIVVIIAAVLAYVFGGRIYDWIWLYQRKDYSIAIVRREKVESG